MMCPTTCTCSRFSSFSLLDRWQIRVEPIIRRALKRGHRVDPLALGETAALVIKLADRAPECFSPAAAIRAIHLKDCPHHPCNRINIVSSALAGSQTV